MALDDNKAAPGSGNGPGAEFFPRLSRLIGHRGAKAVAPENTLVSFRRAAEDGAGWIEFDVRLSADGIPIIFHDDTLERTTNGRGAIADHDLAALKQLDAGAWFAPGFANQAIPTFSETLDICQALALGMNIEIKPNPGEARITALAALELVEARSTTLPGRVLFSSFKVEALEALQEAGAHWPRGLLLDQLDRGWRSDARRLACVSLHPRADCLDSPKIVAEIQAQGLLVLPFTVNDPERAKELIDWGVDAVITDDPRRLSTRISGA